MIYIKQIITCILLLHLIRCLHPTEGVLPFALPKSLKAIIACFKLHNKCINDGVPNPDIEFEEDLHDINVNADLPPNPAGHQIRQRLVQRFQ